MNVHIPVRPRSLATIKEFLSYDPATGFFRWAQSPNNRAPRGAVAGALTNGYITIRFGGHQYRASVLAWWFVYDILPNAGQVIDHINGVPSDNRISNLRLCTQSLNIHNQRGRGATSLYKGVYFRSKSRRWEAAICRDGKQIYLGRFDTEEQAARAYNAAANSLYGLDARLNFVGQPHAE